MRAVPPSAEGAGGDTGPVVTLDGPAGSGKSTTARAVARRLGFRHLDSGALYRALTWALLQAGVPPAEWPSLTREELDRFRIHMEPGPDERFEMSLAGTPLQDAELRGPAVTRHVSSLARLPSVRSWLLGKQQEVSRLGGLVADGRDMGTVVFPAAQVKIFLTATLDERARRRLRDHGVHQPGEAELGEERQRIQSRDEQDSSRELSPLRPAPDAWILDTTGLDFEAQVEAIVGKVEELLSS